MAGQDQVLDKIESYAIRPFTPEMQKLKDKLDVIRQKHIKKGLASLEALLEKIKYFKVKLCEEYPDFQKYEAYHVIAGSGIKLTDDVSQFKSDFSGDYSVENFILGLEAELVEKEKQ